MIDRNLPYRFLRGQPLKQCLYFYLGISIILADSLLPKHPFIHRSTFLLRLPRFLRVFLVNRNTFK